MPRILTSQIQPVALPGPVFELKLLSPFPALSSSDQITTSAHQARPTLAIGQLQAEADVNRTLTRVNLHDPQQAPTIAIQTFLCGNTPASPSLTQEWLLGNTRMDEMLHQIAEIVSDGFFKVEMDETSLTTQCKNARYRRHQRQAFR